MKALEAVEAQAQAYAFAATGAGAAKHDAPHDVGLPWA